LKRFSNITFSMVRKKSDLGWEEMLQKSVDV
jgi:hypothetical protein